MEIRDSSGEKLHSPTNGSSECLNQQDFYGKHQPEFVISHIMISAKETKFRPNASFSDFHFGVLTAGVDVVFREKSGKSHPILSICFVHYLFMLTFMLFFFIVNFERCRSKHCSSFCQEHF